MSLSEEHPAVHVAESALTRYEHDVGIHLFSSDLITLARRVRLLLGDIPVSQSLVEKAWRERLGEFCEGVLTSMGEDTFRTAMEEVERKGKEAIPNILDLELDPPRSRRSERDVSIVDLTDSEQSESVESEMPQTPRPRRAYGGRSSGETRSLNKIDIIRNKISTGKYGRHGIPHASSPSTTSSSPQTSADDIHSIADSSHPHIRSSSLPPTANNHVNFQKDEHGFWIPASYGIRSSPSPPSFNANGKVDDSTLLPPFLLSPSGRAKKPTSHSRTRQIIDRLRGANGNHHQSDRDGLRGRTGGGKSPVHATGKAATAPDGSSTTNENQSAVGLIPATRSESVALSVHKLFQKGADGWIQMNPSPDTTSGSSPPSALDRGLDLDEEELGMLMDDGGVACSGGVGLGLKDGASGGNVAQGRKKDGNGNGKKEGGKGGGGNGVGKHRKQNSSSGLASAAAVVTMSEGWIDTSGSKVNSATNASANSNRASSRSGSVASRPQQQQHQQHSHSHSHSLSSASSAPASVGTFTFPPPPVPPIPHQHHPQYPHLHPHHPHHPHAPPPPPAFPSMMYPHSSFPGMVLPPPVPPNAFVNGPGPYPVPVSVAVGMPVPIAVPVASFNPSMNGGPGTAPYGMFGMPMPGPGAQFGMPGVGGYGNGQHGGAHRPRCPGPGSVSGIGQGQGQGQMPVSVAGRGGW